MDQQQQQQQSSSNYLQALLRHKAPSQSSSSSTSTSTTVVIEFETSSSSKQQQRNKQQPISLDEAESLYSVKTNSNSNMTTTTDSAIHLEEPRRVHSSGGSDRNIDNGDNVEHDHIRGIDKRIREKQHYDKKVKPWSDRWNEQRRGQRVGSCTKKIDQGNSSKASYCPCCRQHACNMISKRAAVKKERLEAEKKLVSL